MRRFSFLRLVFFSALILISASNAVAKNMPNRLGLGYRNQFASDLPGIAMVYYPGALLGLSAVLGIDTEEDRSRFGLMAKIHRVVFDEDNLNFYLGAGAGLASQEFAGENASGFELLGFAGTEFFLPGLESTLR